MGWRLSPSLPAVTAQPSPPEASRTIIVTDANALVGKIHSRVPVVLGDADVGRWRRPMPTTIVD
jgi:putative SOS response-associated peptidase YedK